MNIQSKMTRVSIVLSMAMLLTLGVLLGLTTKAARAGTAVFINEIHYDNASGDVNEGVEIAGPAGTDLTGWSIELYNGNNSLSYGAISLSGAIPDQQNGFGAIWFARSGIQNGAPDGLALVDSSSAVIQFLSYEGSFTAGDGPANGMTSTDIGVFEPGTTPIGYSLQLVGGGSVYEDFTWGTVAISNTYDAVNTGQTFSGGTTPALGISKSAPTMVAPNAIFTYTIVVANGTGITTTGTIITDVVPANATFASASDGGVQAGGVVSWTVPGQFVDGSTITRTFQVTASSSSGVNIVNDDYGVSASNWTTFTAGSPITTTVAPLDLSVSKTGPAVAIAGRTLVYQIAIDNTGVATATNVVLTDTLPLSTTYTSDDSGITHTEPISGVLVWSFGGVPSNTTPTFNLTVTVDGGVASGTWLTNTVGVATDTAGDDPSNNTDQWATLIAELVSIHDIQYVPDPANDDASPYEGQQVWVEGVVTANSDDFGGSRYFIEDPAGGPWSGLYVYHGGDRGPVQEGDQVLLYGEVLEYWGLTEFDLRDSANGEQYILSSGNPLPAAEVLTTGLYATTTPTTAEPYEGVLIEFQDATVTDDDLGYGEWAFDDGTGETRADDLSSSLTYVPTNGDLYNYIRGLGYYSHNDYKLVPRYDADVLVWTDRIEIAKHAPTLVDPGELLTYTIAVVNPFTYTLDDLVITDIVPANAAFAYPLDCGVLNGDVVSWTVASLATLESVNVRFVVTAPITVGTSIWNHDYAVWASNWTTPTLGEPVLTVVGDYIPIPVIQGPGFRSPLVGATVETVGVVIGFFEGNASPNFDGFYIQDTAGDGIPATSDGIFVKHATSVNPGVIVGDLVTVTGTVDEFSEWDGPSCVGDECQTQIYISNAGAVEVGSNGGAPPALVLNPPGDPIVAAAYWESLEGMLVTHPATNTVVGPTSYGTIMVVPGSLGVERVMRTGPYAGMPVGVRFYNRYGSGADNLIVGSVVENVDGPLAFTYGNHVIITQQGDDWVTVYDKPAPAAPPSWPEPPADQFSVASYNTYNFDSAGTHVTKVVSTVVQMGGPTFLAFQEIDVQTVVTDVIDNLAAAGYSYDYAYSHPDVGEHGVAVLWRTDRVSDVVWSTQYQGCSPNGSSSSEAYDDYCDAIPGEHPLFSRRPVVVTGTLSYDGIDTQVVVIGNHFKSKLGGAAADQRRLEQGQLVAGLVDDFVANGMANVLVMGDLNDFEDAPPLQALYASGNLTSTWYTLPPGARYSYIYNGVSQILDHVLASSVLMAQLEAVSPLHYNADYPYNPYFGDDSVIWRSSDHDPVLAYFHLPHPADFAASTKSSTAPNQQVMPGGLVTYTITLTNSGDLDANVLITDVLGGYYTVCAALDFAESPAGTLTWSGVVTAGRQVVLQFVAQVVGLTDLPIGQTTLDNAVRVNDGVNNPFTVDDPSPPWVKIHGIYLPLVMRSP